MTTNRLTVNGLAFLWRLSSLLTAHSALQHFTFTHSFIRGANCWFSILLNFDMQLREAGDLNQQPTDLLGDLLYPPSNSQVESLAISPVLMYSLVTGCDGTTVRLKHYVHSNAWAQRHRPSWRRHLCHECLIRWGGSGRGGSKSRLFGDTTPPFTPSSGAAWSGSTLQYEGGS